MGRVEQMMREYPAVATYVSKSLHFYRLTDLWLKSRQKYINVDPAVNSKMRIISWILGKNSMQLLHIETEFQLSQDQFSIVRCSKSDPLKIMDEILQVGKVDTTQPKLFIHCHTNFWDIFESVKDPRLFDIEFEINACPTFVECSSLSMVKSILFDKLEEAHEGFVKNGSPCYCEAMQSARLQID